MTLSTILDTGPRITLGRETAAARKPGSSNREASKLPVGRRVGRDHEDDRLTHATAQFEATARFLTSVEVIQADKTNSVTAHARVASAAYLSGENELAASGARQALRLAKQLDTADIAYSIASIQTAALVLLGLNFGAEMGQLLAGIPTHPILVELRATALIEDARIDEALALLESVNEAETPAASALLGYIRLVRGEYQRAVAELRKAYRRNPGDIDSVMNLAVACWRIGSTKKAIKFSRQAVALAPYRKDSTLALLNFLVGAGQFEAASAELKRLHDRNIRDLPELGAVQAQIAYGQGDMRRAATGFRNAAELATEEGETGFAAELRGNAIVVELERGKISLEDARVRVRECLQEAPKSIPLVTMLASLTYTVSNAGEVKAFADNAAKPVDVAAREGLLSRLAFLELHFEEAMERAVHWATNDPFNDAAASVAVHLLGHWTEDWSKASKIGLDAIKRTGYREGLSNITAYALALAGEGDVGLEVLSHTGALDYVRTATKGLCLLAKGDLLEGMGLYRSAADLADRERPDGSGRALMTQYQAMALKRLSSVQHRDRLQIQATALPDVDLPSDWEDRVDFLFLKAVAARNGWGWPVSV